MAAPVEITQFPFKLNAPIHPSLLHQAPAIGMHGAGQPGTGLRGEIYNTEKLTYENTANTDSTFQNLRLGRMVMGKQALSYAMQKSQTRYGFRFLYNPTEVNGGTNVGTDFIPNPNDTIMFVLQEGLETIQFELFLNRTPEVRGHAKPSDYHGGMDADEFREIQERGTHYDLEYLYRLANGTHATNTRSNTGDIGILLPNPCELFLGPFRSRGALVSISATDIMYSSRMVPMLTYVQVSFARYLTMDDEGMNTLRSGGVGSQPSDSDEDGGSGGPSSGGSSPGKRGKLTGREVYDLARGAGWSSGNATTMTQISYMESSWDTGAYNPDRSTGDNSYGLWQINMLAHTPASLGISKNEDLFDPVINAKAAFKVGGNGTKFTPWTVWKNGTYVQAPPW